MSLVWSIIISKVTAFDLSNAVTLRELRNYGQASGYNRFAISFFWVFKMVFGDYPITNILSRELQKFSYRKAFALFWGNIRTIPGKKSASTQELFYIFW